MRDTPRSRDGSRRRDDVKPRRPTVPPPPPKNMPVAKYKKFIGRDTCIDVAVWANTHEGEYGEFEKLTVTISRSYKNDQGEWKQGGSFDDIELAVLSSLLQMVQVYILNRKGGISEE